MAYNLKKWIVTKFIKKIFKIFNYWKFTALTIHVEAITQ